MTSRPALLCLAAITCGLPSCGLIKVPFKVTGAVIEGTAQVGRSTYDASKKAFGKSEEEKAEDNKKKAEERKKKADEDKARRQGEARAHADAVRQQQGQLNTPVAPPPGSDDTLPPLPEPPPEDLMPYQ